MPSPSLVVGLLALYLLERRRSSESSLNHPAPNSVDWSGWCWPVPVLNGRAPEVTDTYSRTLTATHRKHLGVDVMYRKLASEQPGVANLPYDSKHYTSQGARTPVIAAGPGKIWEASLSPRGYQVTVDHGKHAGGCTTYYQHISQFSRAWAKGDAVEAGDILGLMGGDISPGANPVYHLHFELLFPRAGTSRDAWTADPVPYMKLWSKRNA